jgi:SAM-dependent methyltransferase
MPGATEWSSLAEFSDPDEIRERILTGFKDGKPFTPYVPTLALPSPLGDVLDFGCGLGRNFPLLNSLAARVTGFDLPPMIARCRTLAADRVHRLTDDWTALSAERFDLIYASLVLQHVDTDTCRRALAGFARMAPTVYLLTRARTDFGLRMFDLVADAGAFDPGECVEVEHDMSTHQLRVIRRVPFDVARASDDGHFEVLLGRR